MPKANDLKKGMIVQVDGKPHIVRRSESKSPSSRGAATLYKIRLNCLLTRQNIDLSLKGDEFLHEADCQRTEVQYSYKDGDNYIFMSVTDFTQYSLHSDELEWQTQFLVEQQEDIIALLLDGILIGIELPQSIKSQITAPEASTTVAPPKAVDDSREITCPECQHKFRIRIPKGVPQAVVECPACNSDFGLDFS